MRSEDVVEWSHDVPPASWLRLHYPKPCIGVQEVVEETGSFRVRSVVLQKCFPQLREGSAEVTALLLASRFDPKNVPYSMNPFSTVACAQGGLPQFQWWGDFLAPHQYHLVLRRFPRYDAVLPLRKDVRPEAKFFARENLEFLHHQEQWFPWITPLVTGKGFPLAVALPV